MLLYLILLLTIVPLVEFLLLFWIGGRIGLLATIGLVVGTGILGAAIARWQGVSTMARMQRELSQGIMPADALFDGVLIFGAAVLLILPGVLSDSLGFLLLVPPVRSVVKNHIRRRFVRRVDTQVWTNDPTPNDQIIDVKVSESQ